MFEKELETAIYAIKKASKVVLEVYFSKNLDIEIKSDDSPVTRADKLSDRLISSILKKAFPNYALLTEESIDDKARLNNDYVWIVDPVDGTKDFIERNGEFTINIALAYKHEPVVGVICIPCSNEIYFARKGAGSFYDNGKEIVKIHANDKIDDLTTLTSRFFSKPDDEVFYERHKDKIKHRRCVGSSIKACLIAKGEAEVSYRGEPNFTKEWDICAMQIILEEAGALLLKLDGTKFSFNRDDVYNHVAYLICNRIENFMK